MSGSSFVRVENLGHRFAGQRVLDDITFDVGRGEILGLLGPNGAGKSTTLRILSGTLAPDHGRVMIGDADVHAQPVLGKSRLGYLPDTPPIYPELSVDEYLRFCASLRGVANRELSVRVGEAKERCALEGCADRLIGHLSKGYQQRVGIAQAIVHRPMLVILDEPTVGLDPLQIRDIRVLIAELAGEHSVILSSHLLAEVQTTCDRVQIIDRGRGVLNQPIAQLQQNNRQLKVSFTQPPTLDELKGLIGVEQVVALPDNSFRITHPNVDDLPPKVVETSVAKNWGLTALSAERTTLEEVFVALIAEHHDVTDIRT
jgi:ABC-2 type transport system ATP-binding protein